MNERTLTTPYSYLSIYNRNPLPIRHRLDTYGNNPATQKRVVIYAQNAWHRQPMNPRGPIAPFQSPIIHALFPTHWTAAVLSWENSNFAPEESCMKSWSCLLRYLELRSFPDRRDGSLSPISAQKKKYPIDLRKLRFQREPISLQPVT